MELEFWGDVGADPESLMGGQGWVWGWGTSPTKRSGSIGRGRGPFQKNRYFSWHGMRWCILSGIFGPRFRQKKCWIFTWSGILVDVEDVLLRSNEYFAGVMGLVNFLLHLIVMLVMQAIWGLKFLNVIKSGGQLALVSPTVVERRSVTGELSLSYAQPAADGWPLMWVNRRLQGQPTRPTQPFILSRWMNE